MKCVCVCTALCDHARGSHRARGKTLKNVWCVFESLCVLTVLTEVLVKCFYTTLYCINYFLIYFVLFIFFTFAHFFFISQLCFHVLEPSAQLHK